MDKAPEPKRPRIGENGDESVQYPLKLYHSDPRNGPLYQESLTNPDKFWGDQARSRIRWMKDFEKVKEVDMEKGDIKWFLGGQLNVSGIECNNVQLQLQV